MSATPPRNKTGPKAPEIRIGARLRQAEASLSERLGRPVAARELCTIVTRELGVPLSPSTYSLLRSDRRAPTVQQLVALARALEVTPEFFLGGARSTERLGTTWFRRIPALGAAEVRYATALEAVLSGEPLTPALCKRLGLGPPSLGDAESIEQVEWQIGRLAQSAVFLGLSQLDVSESAVDLELGEAVRERLASDPHLPDALRRRLVVTVVKNPVDASFPNRAHVAPLIVGQFGLGLVGRFLERHPHVSAVGLAGGFHVASLVRQVGNGELRWPERSYRLYPLTIEPFAKQITLSDVLVGDLSHRLGALMGPERIQGYTLRAFGYLTDDGEIVLRQRSITTVLDQLTEVDLAVLGVGDSLTPDGPLQRVLAMQGYKIDAPEAAMADVCLNPINEAGELIAIRPGSKGVAQLIGIDTEQLRRMAQLEKHKLVLLLSTGARKARSTRAIVRGGFVSHVLCDDVLARALLDEPS
jgi:transcriptional regulator with XRE-family HTH domain